MTLPEHLQPLLDPSAYSHDVQRVELIQTHISYVFLAGEYVYKVKKPLNLEFLDYSTLERRRLMCEEEVRLNRRLCEDAYLGVSRITTNRGLRVDGAGETVEYAVKMRRQPADRMMTALLDRGFVTDAHVRSIAAAVAVFHERSQSDARIAAFGRPDTVRRNWDENFGQTAAFVGRTITESQYDDIRGYVSGFIGGNASLFDARAGEGRVVDCHGDLRSDAIVIRRDGSICIMDCIEFNDRLRFGDVATDVAFLAMDLDYRGRPDLADEFVATYLGLTADGELPLVLGFYRCYRAYVRGKVESLMSDEAEVPAPERTRAEGRARAYFALARRYAMTVRRQRLVMMIGLSGSGKSHLAYALAGRIGAAVISTDVLRKRSVAGGTAGRREAPVDSGLYAPDQRRRVYSEMIEDARRHLVASRSVILDAAHLARGDRERAAALSRGTGVPLSAVLVSVDEDVTRGRLEARRRESGSVSDAGWDVYVSQRARFEPPDELPASQVIRVDGALRVSDTAGNVLSALEDPPPGSA